MKRSYSLYNALIGLITFTLIYIAYTGRFDALSITSALIVSTIITYYLYTGRSFQERMPLDFHRMLSLFKYLYLFILAELREHAELSKIILSKNLKIAPGVIDVPFDLTSEVAISLVALTITNTPGTIAVDLNLDKKVMSVHWINIKTAEPVKARQMILGEFETLAKRIFG